MTWTIEEIVKALRKYEYNEEEIEEFRALAIEVLKRRQYTSIMSLYDLIVISYDYKWGIADLVRAETKEQERLLVESAKSGWFSRLKEQIEKRGLAVNVHDEEGKSNLYHAAEAGHVDIVYYLIQRGAENYGSHDGNVPLQVAVKKGHMKIVQILAEKFPDDINRKNPLRTTWQHRFPDKINTQTPLIIAAQHNWLDIASYLLSIGADPLIKSKDDETAYNIALKNGNLWLASTIRRYLNKLLVESINDSEKLKKIIEAGANLETAIDTEKSTILSFMVKAENIDIVRYLVDKGSNICASNEMGDTPLGIAMMIATEKDNNELLEFLMSSMQPRPFDRRYLTSDHSRSR